MEATERHLHLVPPLPEMPPDYDEEDELHCWRCFDVIPATSEDVVCDTCWRELNAVL